MTRTLTRAAALLCLATCPIPAAARDAGGTAPSAETQLQDRLQGTWAIEFMEIQGMKIDKAKGLNMSLTFRGDKLVMWQGTTREEGAYRADEGRSPKSLDLIAPKTTRQDAVQCIYHVEGDTLKIGFYSGAPDRGRPDRFDAKEVLVLTFKRQK